ncbi:MAG: Alkylated DNA repair protein AlkB, partial [uncultured Acidimicrobiales bacterium]
GPWLAANAPRPRRPVDRCVGAGGAHVAGRRELGRPRTRLPLVQRFAVRPAGRDHRVAAATPGCVGAGAPRAAAHLRRPRPAPARHPRGRPAPAVPPLRRGPGRLLGQPLPRRAGLGGLAPRPRAPGPAEPHRGHPLGRPPAAIPGPPPRRGTLDQVRPGRGRPAGDGRCVPAPLGAHRAEGRLRRTPHLGDAPPHPL